MSSSYWTPPPLGSLRTVTCASLVRCPWSWHFLLILALFSFSLSPVPCGKQQAVSAGSLTFASWGWAGVLECPEWRWVGDLEAVVPAGGPQRELK